MAAQRPLQSQSRQSLSWRNQEGASTRLVTEFSSHTYHTSLHSVEKLADSGSQGNNRIRTLLVLYTAGRTAPTRVWLGPLLKQISL